MSSVALVPISAEERQRAYQAMTRAGREAADALAELLRKGQTGTVRVAYAIGCRLLEIFKKKNEELYGPQYADQLAAYLAIEGGASTLHALANFARTFPREFVEEWSSKQMANGHYLTVSHWLKLSQMENREDQERLLQRIVQEGLSARDLEMEIRSGQAGRRRHARQGGRRPKVPSSPVGGLWKAFELTQRFNRYEATMEKHVFERLNELPADKVTPLLKERLESCLAEAEKAQRNLDDLMTRLRESLHRVERVLSLRTAASSAGADDGPATSSSSSKDEDEPAEPSARSNGRHGGRRGTRRGRPTTAVAAVATAAAAK